MTTTRNKIAIEETLYMENIIKIQAFEDSEYIRIDQKGSIVVIRIDEISHLISSLQRFLENGEIVDDFNHDTNK